MRKLQFVSTMLFALLGAITTAQASTVIVPLDASEWVQYPAVGGGTQVGASMGTVTNNVEGHLIATKTTNTGGSSQAYFLGRDTKLTYDLQNATLRYQWKLDGMGTYAGTYNGLLTEGHGGLAYYRPMTTSWVYGSSILIPSNTWLYTEYKFSEAGHMWEYSIGTSGYGGTSIAHGIQAFAAWDALKTARPYLWIGDNYAAGAHFELAEMTITPVPEPGTVALMLAGLAALGLVARRARA